MTEPTSLFLTTADIEHLTGTRQRRLQMAWLRANGIRFWLNRANVVVVPRSAVDGVASAQGSNEPKVEWEPNVLKSKKAA